MPRNSYDGVTRPLWPALRLEARALVKALRRSQATSTALDNAVSSYLDSEAPVDVMDEADLRLTAVLDDEAVIARLPRLDAPDHSVLTPLGRALVGDTLAFRPLFDSVERLLERRAAQELYVDRNIAWLATILGLSKLEEQVLSLCVALDLGSVERSLFSHAGSAVQKVSALRAATQVGSEHALVTLTGNGGVLQRSGLLRNVQRGDSDLADLLQLSPLGTLLTTTRFRSVQAMAKRVLKPLPKAGRPLTWPHLQERTTFLTQLVHNSLRGNEAGINILIYGPPGTGKTAYARQLIDDARATGYAIDDSDEEGEPASRQERLGYLRLCERFAPSGQSVLVLDEAEDIFQSDYANPLTRVLGQRAESKSWMNHLLEHNRVPTIWISNQISHLDPAYLRRFTYCLEFPVAPRAQRRTMAHEHLAKVGASTEIVERMAAHATLPPALLASAARFVSLSAAGPQQVDAAAAHMLSDHLRAMGQPLRRGVVASEARFDLAYLNAHGSIQPGAILKGLARLGRGSVLLSGPPGTGKTQMAAEIAKHLERDLVYRTAADINSKWYGESERNVADLFTQCDPNGEVLFLDEADTLLGERTDGGHRADHAVTAEFLRRIEAFEGVFVCATNHAGAFDRALMRRFMFRLELQPLTDAQRKSLLCERLRAPASEGTCGDVELSEASLLRLRRLNLLTPGDFANVARRFDALDLQPDANAWLDELEAEHRTKPGADRGTMGFR